MMIIYNEFPEFEDDAIKIDKEYYYVNISIIREPKDGKMFNRYGEIHIPDTDSRIIFSGGLVHEVAHSFFDPITLENYINCLNVIKKYYEIGNRELAIVGNIITDMICDFNISKNSNLKRYRRQYLKECFNIYYNPYNALSVLIWSFYNKVHNLKLKHIPRNTSKYVNMILDILEKNMSRENKYLSISKIILEFINETKSSINGDVESPLTPTEEEINKIVENIFTNSSDSNEAKDKIELLITISSTGSNELNNIINNNDELFKHFYQAKANEIRKFISYPKVTEYKGVKVGSKKWKLSDGIDKMDVKKTLLKYGINIPLVTTSTSRVNDKFISNRESSKPIDIVISIDISGSVGSLSGSLNNISDNEIIMLFALIDEAKRIKQKVGLTLWDDKIKLTTLPRTYDYKDVDKLKKLSLSIMWGLGGTNISNPLQQAKEYSDKLFLIFTDGDVYFDQPENVSNVIFFLVSPKDSDYECFVKNYGEKRVIRIDDVSNIPKVTIKWYRGVFK